MKTLFTLLVACFSILTLSEARAFTKAPPKTESKPSAAPPQSKPFRIISDKTKSCVLAPTAKTELEKRAVLIAAASDYALKNPEKMKAGKENELCLAFLANEESGEPINVWTPQGSPQQMVEPGSIKWTQASNEPVVTINPGFEREDAETYVVTLASVVGPSGKACVRTNKKAKTCKPDYKLALKLIHEQLKVTEHPLDWLLAP
ncbi:MAG: hypothetical protein EOP05_07035 [Proteobacteria bacterium]|nr:MAG: hypothetical protein EOP05_07035 [Pseudomonadota bacterium]